MKHPKRNFNGKYAKENLSFPKKVAIFVLGAAVLVGVSHQILTVKPALAEESTKIEVTQDPIETPCIQLEAKSGGYIGSFYCAEQKLLDKETVRMNVELQKLKGKTFKASISMYSRLDSCHNPRGKACLTAAGHDTKEGSTIACPRNIKLGTKVKISGHIYTCDDRTAKWVEDKFGPTYDIFTEDQTKAINFGRKTMEVTIVE